MELIKLNFNQAKTIQNDFLFIIGKTYEIKRKMFIVESVDIEELDSKDGYTVVVRYEYDYEVFKYLSIIDDFCSEAKIDFDVKKYID